MKSFMIGLGLVGALAGLVVPASAQDYRARVQGSVTDASPAALPGATVILTNDATGVSTTRVCDGEGRFLFDFVDPGMYTITAELDGFKKAVQSVRVQQRGDVTANLTLEIGAIEESVTVQAQSVSVQFNSSSSDITLERQIIDQVPISGRNPYNLAALDPTIIVSPATNENRPYHHAYANDYDAGGGTRRANDVLLDGVALGASFKTAYTPAVDAVEEITISKNSVDAENGHSLGGIISLNMKSGTNQYKGSAYYYLRDPSLNAVADPTLKLNQGQAPVRGSELNMYGGTFGFPVKKNKMFSFTSFEQWNDNRPLSIIRTVPTAAERTGDFSQSTLSGRVRTLYDPFTSVRRSGDQPGRAHAVRGQRHSDQPIRSRRVEDAAGDAAAQPAGQHRQLAGQPLREGRLLELLAARRREPQRQREDVRALRPVQGQPVPAEPDRRAASSRCRAATGTA